MQLPKKTNYQGAGLRLRLLRKKRQIHIKHRTKKGVKYPPANLIGIQTTIKLSGYAVVVVFMKLGWQA
jgi:hypothetical protein